MLQPQTVPFLSLLEQYHITKTEIISKLNVSELKHLNISYPSYPDYTVCENYLDNCYDMISKTNVTALIPNCNKKLNISSHNIVVFPNTTQVISNIHIVFNNNSFNIPLMSSPNYMSNANDNGFETNCPSGFVVPDDPDNPRNQMIVGTGCAIPCRVPEFTKSDYKRIDLIQKSFPEIGIISNAIFLITLFFEKDEAKKKSRYLLKYLAILGLVYSLMALYIPLPIEKKFCISNSIPISSKYDGINYCIFQGAVLSYVITAASCCFLAIATNLYVVIRYGNKSASLSWLWKLYTSVIIIEPLIPLFLNYDNIGYDGKSSACFLVSMSSNRAFYSETILTLLLNLFVGFILLFSSIRIELSHSLLHYNSLSPNSKATFKDLIKISYKMTHRTAIFLVAYFCLLIPPIVFQANNKFHESIYTASMKDWINCVFSNYDGNTDESWLSICNDHPSVRPNLPFSAYTALIRNFGWSVLPIIFLLPSVSRFVTVLISNIFNMYCKFRVIRKVLVHPCQRVNVHAVNKEINCQSSTL